MQTPLISRALQRCARLLACLWLTGCASTPEVLHGPRSPMYARK
jgi:hypothetical protein